MSDTVTALQGARFQGFATIREAALCGMITLRATPDTPGLAQAVRDVTGTELPAERQILRNGARGAGWMGPDEYLLLLPHDEAPAAVTALGTALAGQHHLAVNVSDARAVLRIEGPEAAQVLRKLTPADLSALAPGELRRSRAGQVAVAFWAEEGGFTLVCFRSVAGYVMDLLSHAAREGSQI